MCYSPATELYDPKAFITHAASLHQSFLHCAIFPTAASRRSLDRVPVPVWPFTLSGRLPIAGLVSRYLTNYLIGRRLLHRRIAALTTMSIDTVVLCGISLPFERLSPIRGQITYVLLTRSPLATRSAAARLACLRRAASVSSEPGSNSPL